MSELSAYDIRSLFDAIGHLADNSAPDSELTDNVGELATSLDSLHDLLDGGLSQLNSNLGRIADALENGRDMPDFDTVEAAGLDGTTRETGRPVTWRMVAEATRPPF